MVQHPVQSQTALSLTTQVARSKNSPAKWLDHKGKPDAWYTDTESCRRLLYKLKLEDPLVKQYLPNIRRHTEMIGRVDGFDWKTITAVEFLQRMLQDLSAGQQPNLRYAGDQLALPYWSNTMQRIEAIWTHVPPKYDTTKSYQVFMYYKCGGGIHCKDGRAAGGYRPTVEVANQTDSFHCWSSLNIQIKGRMGGYIELSEAMDALCREFRVDRDRVFLTGWSDGGFTAVWLASHYPHLVAGIAPNCANWQYTNVEYLGLTNLPTLNVDGWFDGGYNRISFVRWQMLRNDQADTACIWGQHGHSYQPYEDVEEFKYIHEWAKQYRRDLYPKRVRYATWNLAWHRAYWASIERMIDPLLACQIDIEAKPDNRFDGRTWNVAELKLSLCDELMDMTRPVTVTINGQEVYTGPAKPELDIEMIGRPQTPFVKDVCTSDEITAVTVGSSYDTNGFLAIPQRRWISVRPTEQDEATSKVLNGWWPEIAEADDDVTDKDLTECNLILYGGPEMNQLTARIADQLPLNVARGRFSIGSDVYDLPTHCVAFLHPNPLNPEKYVIVYACNDPATFAANDFFGMRGESIYRFRSGDAVISGIPTESIDWGVAVRDSVYKQRHVLLGPDWRPDERPPLGEAVAGFDYLQLLRLRADALREAADVDIGIIWAHTPPWSRWEDGMPRGPITLQALATQDAFPEQVCVGEIRGEDLLRPQSSPAAWSLLADKRHPAYVARKTLAVSDIDPQKTYRIAMGFHGIPIYGTNPKEMPRLFTWATRQEFLTNTNNSIRIQNLTRTPLQVAETVAQYIRKHRRVAPRPMYFSLTDYIINPENNHFGACDWLHLATDVTWPDKAAGGTDRYTLSLGLRPSETTDSDEPGTGSKHFAELDLTQENPIAFDFRILPMKLQLNVTTETRRWAITTDSSSRSCALSDPGVDDAVGGTTLLLLRLESEADEDLALQIVLNRAVMSRIHSEVWPDASCKDKDIYFAGYHRAIGKYREPPVHEDGVLFLSADEAPVVDKLVANNAGYNFGLVGVEHQATIKARSTLVVPILVVWVKRPERAVEFRLLDVLMAVKAGLIRQLPTDGAR
jgi:pimeloyl-ACP methyl ester carboxylesterase